MKKAQLAKADFVKAADALTNESFHGHNHLAICQSIAEIDPFVGNYAPVFFTYAFYGNLNSAQMHANKLFDTHHDAVTVPQFLEMVRLRSVKFPNTGEKEVLAGIAEAELVIKKLSPTLKVLRTRRNDFLAHLSPKFAFAPEKLQQAAKLTMPEIREVLHEGGKIVNQFLQMWNNSVNQIHEHSTNDCEKISSLVSSHLCAEIQAHEAEFARYGLTERLPRPRNCP